jgi:hypothetical protein
VLHVSVLVERFYIDDVQFGVVESIYVNTDESREKTAIEAKKSELEHNAKTKKR